MIHSIKIQPVYSGREAIAAISSGNLLELNWYYGNTKSNVDCVPIGDVPYCESWLVRRPIPDFYPEWTKPAWHRRIQILKPGDDWDTGLDYFVKSADGYKDFEARIYTNRDDSLPCGNIWLSSVVNFVQEWRYYIADGKVMATGWYLGNDEDEPAPDLPVEVPEHWYGAADFGRLDTGKIALVECQHGYACGHYCERHADYIRWAVKCWENIVETYGLK